MTPEDDLNDCCEILKKNIYAWAFGVAVAGSISLRGWKTTRRFSSTAPRTHLLHFRLNNSFFHLLVPSLYRQAFDLQPRRALRGQKP